MKTKHTICGTFALLAVCLCGVARSQDDAVKMVLDILKGDDQDMQSAAISMVKDLPVLKLTLAPVERRKDKLELRRECPRHVACTDPAALRRR